MVGTKHPSLHEFVDKRKDKKKKKKKKMFPFVIFFILFKDSVGRNSLCIY